MLSADEALSQDEIDNLLSSLSASGPPAPPMMPSTGLVESPVPMPDENEGFAMVGGEKRNLKLYNFRRPDKFSKDHLKALQTIHEAFARQLSMILTAYLRMHLEVNVVSVDQLTYDEFIRSMPSPVTVTIVEMVPLPGQALLGFSQEICTSMIDRMLGGPGQSEAKPRELTDIEQSLMRRVIDRAVDCLEEAWHSFVSVAINQVGMEDSYTMIQVASPGEIVALVTFEVVLSQKDSGLMNFCIPYPVLESVMGQLSAQRIFNRQEDSLETETEKILQKLHYAKIPVEVFLSGTQLTVQELLELSEGDVIRLDRLATQDLLVNVNHKPKFYGRPGKVKNKLAIYVTESVQNEETIEGFGFNG